MRRYSATNCIQLLTRSPFSLPGRSTTNTGTSARSFSVKGEKAPGDHYIRIRDRSLKIEWEASAGYWSMPPKTYRALGTREPITVRVTAQLGTYYHGDFSDKGRQFQSIDLESRSHDGLIGYVRRNTPECEELLELLSDGNKHEVTLSVGNVNEETAHVVIYSVVSKTWLPNKESAVTWIRHRSRDPVLENGWRHRREPGDAGRLGALMSPTKMTLTQALTKGDALFDHGPYLIEQSHPYQSSVWAVCSSKQDLQEKLSPLSPVEILRFYALDDIEQLSPRYEIAVDDDEALSRP